MAAYCAGDREAFARLFARLAPRVHGFFRRAFRSEAVADDLLQTTFLKLHQARHQYRQGQPLRPWLFAIAARVRSDEHRRAQRPGQSHAPNNHFDFDFDEGDAALADPRRDGDERTAGGAAFAAEDAERVRLVRDALDQLPESQRVIVQLHRYGELTFAEIGEALGLSAGAVKLRAFRAYERLRRQLRPLTDREVANR